MCDLSEVPRCESSSRQEGVDQGGEKAGVEDLSAELGAEEAAADTEHGSAIKRKQSSDRTKRSTWI